MKVLVPGGAGFIGGNFCRYWSREYPKDEIIVLDKFTYAGNRANLANLVGENLKIIEGDICDYDLVKELMIGVDIIVHLAAESHVDRSLDGAVSFAQSNVTGTVTLLEAYKYYWERWEHENPPWRFINIGTDEEYGSIEVGFFTETDSLNPRSPYAITKACADLMVQSYHRSFNLPVVCSRCTNNFGPYQNIEKFVPRSITNIIDGDPIKVYGSGENRRDWLFVEDHCRAIEILINGDYNGEIFNIGANNVYTNNYIATMICEIMGVDLDKYIEYVQDRPDHDIRYTVNTWKIEKLGWHPQYNFEDALRFTIDWYIDNESWWRPLKRETEEFYARLGR